MAELDRAELDRLRALCEKARQVPGATKPATYLDESFLTALLDAYEATQKTLRACEQTLIDAGVRLGHARVATEKAIRQRDHARAWATFWRTITFMAGVPSEPAPLTGDDADGWMP